jgi:hypothetical protein
MSLNVRQELFVQHLVADRASRRSANRAGVGAKTVRNALRRARHLGLLDLAERPQWRSKHLPNLVKSCAGAGSRGSRNFGRISALNLSGRVQKCGVRGNLRQ